MAIRSSVGFNTYAAYDGTSMAAPHIAGAVALLLSKNRSLSVEQLGYVLTNTAYFNPGLMGARPNNSYGWGRLDALAAANAVPALDGTLTGQVAGGAGLRSVVAASASDPTIPSSAVSCRR